jgi:hypothetical protein
MIVLLALLLIPVYFLVVLYSLKCEIKDKKNRRGGQIIYHQVGAGQVLFHQSGEPGFIAGIYPPQSQVYNPGNFPNTTNYSNTTVYNPSMTVPLQQNQPPSYSYVTNTKEKI